MPNDKDRKIELSVIVPVYKVEEYLDQCVQSLLAQTFKNMEIILVDDGSPDRCGEMCDEYAAKYDNVVAVHKENGGISSARNYGLKYAKADIVGFVDSDDWIDEDMYEKLMEDMLSNNADISSCAMKQVWDDGRIKDEHRNCGKCTVYTGDDTLLKNYDDFSAWNKIYKKILFHDVEYPEGKLYEDARTSYRLFAKARVATASDQCLYNYRQRSSSIMGTFSTINFVDRVNVWNEIYTFMNNRFPDMDLTYMKVRKRKLALELLNMMRTENRLIEDKTVSQALCKELEFDILGYAGFDFKEKLKVFLIRRKMRSA